MRKDDFEWKDNILLRREKEIMNLQRLEAKMNQLLIIIIIIIL